MQSGDDPPPSRRRKKRSSVHTTAKDAALNADKDPTERGKGSKEQAGGHGKKRRMARKLPNAKQRELIVRIKLGQFIEEEDLSPEGERYGRS